MEDLLWDLLPGCLWHLLCHRYSSCWFFVAFSLQISAENPCPTLSQADGEADEER